jgi:3',5'-cyclic AMP phosphodiesterase CpdA
MIRFLAALLMISTGFACKDLFQFNPNEVRLEEKDKNLNVKNIQKIASLPVRDSFKFIVIGDSQRFYEDLDEFVGNVNSLNDEIAFVLLNGDISDFGLNREFNWINTLLRKLRVPYIGVIGNHDMLANGRLIYNKMFGAEDFTFEYSGSKFICLNTNSLEVGHDGSIPDLSWLQQQVSDLSSYKNAFVFAHVPPFDSEFDSKKRSSYFEILGAASHKVRLSIHGHQHKYSLSRPRENELEYLVVSTIYKRNYALITVTDNTYTIEQKFF